MIVVFVTAEGGAVGFEEGDVLVGREVAAEFVDIDGLVVAGDVAVAEFFFVDELNDALFVIDGYHCAVHPALVFVDEGEVGAGVVDDFIDDSLFEDEVGLEEEGVVVDHVVAGEKKGVDVVCAVVDGVVDIDDGCAVVRWAYVLFDFLTVVAHHKHDA